MGWGSELGGPERKVCVVGLKKGFTLGLKGIHGAKGTRGCGREAFFVFRSLLSKLKPQVPRLLHTFDHFVPFLPSK